MSAKALFLFTMAKVNGKIMVILAIKNNIRKGFFYV